MRANFTSKPAMTRKDDDCELRSIQSHAIPHSGQPKLPIARRWKLLATRGRCTADDEGRGEESRAGACNRFRFNQLLQQFSTIFKDKSRNFDTERAPNLPRGVSTPKPTAKAVLGDMKRVAQGFLELKQQSCTLLHDSEPTRLGTFVHGACMFQALGLPSALVRPRLNTKVQGHCWRRAVKLLQRQDA